MNPASGNDTVYYLTLLYSFGALCHVGVLNFLPSILLLSYYFGFYYFD